jgi:DNA-binding MarR family transcriptional regulator
VQNETEPKQTGFVVMPMPSDPAHALQLLHSLYVAQVHDDAPDLSVRQMSIMLTIYLNPPPHTIRALAATLNVTKPVITRALNAMGKLKLVNRRRDPKDKRNVLVQRTVEGTLYLDRLGDLLVKLAHHK